MTRLRRSDLSAATSNWLKENDPRYGLSYKRHRDETVALEVRQRRARQLGQKRPEQSIKEFVDANRHYKGTDCLFVPGAQKHVASQVPFYGRNITAARYMCLLTHGTPKSEGMFARHKCGNGHLSCVNPNHIEWGTPGDNRGDANIHRAMESATAEDKCRAVDARTSK